MKNKEYYNRVYTTSEKYKQHYEDIIYFPLYKLVLTKLNRHDRIFELGCGSGHLAHMLRDNDFNNYVGADFSSVAIAQAKERTDQLFFEQDILQNNIWVNYDIIIATEVFEHLYYEKVLEKLNKGTQIVFSVPNFLCDSHIYSWQDEQSIRNDFEKYINIITIEIAMTRKEKKWFLINGFIK